MGGDAVTNVDDVPSPDLWQCQGTPEKPATKKREAVPAVPCAYRTRDPERKLLGGFAEAVCPFHGRGVFLPWS